MRMLFSGGLGIVSLKFVVSGEKRKQCNGEGLRHV
jgi:hypothetical protein